MVLNKQRLALVVGGAGTLGKAFVNALNDAGFGTLSLDLVANPLAHTSIILHPEGRRKRWQDNLSYSKREVLATLQHRKLNSVFCAAGAWMGGSIGDENVAEVIEEMNRINLQTSVDAAHIAYHALAERGLLVLTGASAALGPTSSMIGYGLSKASTHHLIRSTATDPKFPAHSTVVGILPETLDTPSNREAMPDADFSTWTNVSPFMITNTRS